jgi:hypothetical protein
MKKKPTLAICQAIADGLSLSVNEVLLQAGILHSPSSPLTERTQEAAHLFAQLDERIQDDLLVQHFYCQSIFVLRADAI